jgi:hypothetical protein
MKNLLIKIYNNSILAYLSAFAGLVIYLLKSIRFSTYQYSIIDEGLFLLKGIYFTNGVYQPYQDFGFWMNKLPFGYLFAGWIQKIFGPGIRTGRITAIILSILMLVGIWLITKRITNNVWLASFTTWIYTLNDSINQIYSHFLSEVLVAFLLVWFLFFILGKNRNLFHYGIGGFLLGLILITRQNMLPLLIITPIYVFWENKKLKPLLLLLLPALSIFVFIHFLYWPNILHMWIPWLPKSLTPFLNSIRFEVEGIPFYDPNPPFLTRLYAFWEGVRIHYIPFTASLISILLILSKRKNWRILTLNTVFKLTIFLSVTYLFLMVEHFYATIMLNYCVYCFSVYLSFFPVFGVLSLAVIPNLLLIENKKSKLNIFLAVLFFLIWFTGIFFGGWQKLNGILEIQVPRSFQLPIQTVELWGIFHNKFGWSYDTLRILLPSIAGFFIGLFMLGSITLFLYILRKRNYQVNFSKFTLTSLLILGIIFLPSPLLGGEIELNRCNNILSSFEASGSKLASIIPENSTVYYAGDFSPIVMLYLPTVKIFPQQYEQDYSHRIGGESTTLEKYGYWNDKSAKNWIDQSDFLIISEKNFQRLNLKDKIPYTEFELLYQSEPILSCNAETSLMLFERIK